MMRFENAMRGDNGTLLVFSDKSMPWPSDNAKKLIDVTEEHIQVIRADSSCGEESTDCQLTMNAFLGVDTLLIGLSCPNSSPRQKCINGVRCAEIGETVVKQLLASQENASLE